MRSPELRMLMLALIGLAGLAAARGADAACPRNGLFEPQVLYEAGQFATSIVLGDFDENGTLDFAVTNYDLGNVSIRRGSGTGTFGLHTMFAAGSGPRGITAADFDEDGNLDLAVTNVLADSVRILRGYGDGSFAPPIGYAAGFQNRGVVAADLDEDGILDLAIAARTSVAILIGNGAGGVGDGTFASPVQYPTPSCWGVAVGDFDGDGILDVAAGNWVDASVTMLIGNGAGGIGNGTFHAGPTFATPGGCAEITSGDLDGDGKLDLVAAGSTGVWVMKGNGNATFAITPYISGTQSNDVAIADLDGDGLADIAATDTDLQQMRVLFGDGGGGFPEEKRFDLANGPNGIEAADLNGDGRTDLLAVNSASQGWPGAVSVLLNACGAATPEPQITGVRDVPNDQGGKVFLTWRASALDRPQYQTILGYRVWRRVPAPADVARLARSFAAFDPERDRLVARATGTAIEYWEPLIELPAAFLEGYGFTAPTTQDSMAGSNPYTAFFVQALTWDLYTFYSSGVDSGYSVDNLSPPAPAPFVAVYGGSGTALHWGPSPAPDFAQFRLHRGSSAEFVPDAGNLVAAQRDTGYFDPPATEFYWYKLAAVDVHGNVGRFAIVSPFGPTAVLATALAARYEGGRVSVTWYLSGEPLGACGVYRQVAGGAWTRTGEAAADGAGYVRWQDGDVTAGLRYAYRLGVPTENGEVAAGEIAIEVPGGTLDEAIRVPNPVREGEVTVSLRLPASGTVRVELLDVMGRVVAARTAAGGGGRATLSLARADRLAPGLYFVRVGLPGAPIRRVAVVR